MDFAGGSFEAFFRAEYAGVVRTLLPIVGDRPSAESVAQDAFVKAMARWDRLESYDRPAGWVRRVAIRDGVRAAKRVRRDAPLADATAGADPADTRLAVDAALRSISPRQRAAVVLHHMAGWPVTEVAEVLGCAPATVRVHLHRGRLALAAVLKEDPEEIVDGIG